MSKEKSISLSFRLSPEEDAQLADKAKAAGVTKSALARKLLCSEDRLILLTGGSEIAARLYQLNTKLESYRDREKISVQDWEEVRIELAHIAANLCDIAQYLTDLCNQEVDSEYCQND